MIYDITALSFRFLIHKAFDRLFCSLFKFFEMDFYFAYLRVVGKLQVQFDTVLFHHLLNVFLLQSMGESIVKVRVDESHQFLLLQDDD